MKKWVRDTLKAFGTKRDNWYWWGGGFLFALYMMISGAVAAMSLVYQTEYKPLSAVWVWYVFAFFGYVGLCVALSVGRTYYEKDQRRTG